MVKKFFEKFYKKITPTDFAVSASFLIIYYSPHSRLLT